MSNSRCLVPGAKVEVKEVGSEKCHGGCQSTLPRAGTIKKETFENASFIYLNGVLCCRFKSET